MNKILSIVVIMAGLLITSVAQAEIVVVVNKGNGATLTKSDVSRIFLGKMKKYTPVNASSGNALRAEFNKKALNKSSSQVKAYWSKLVFSGKGTPPKEFASDAEIKAFVASNPNAIGYIDSANLDGTVKAAITL
ncbi:phosphate ABC transporter substrate-binding protein [Psychrobium sp. MM17-31]|uniref:phosphate ABC transporter substrate-binding protein n=1 Tax=Psychrobium sp. MM17-31 TaxID=2917758 RepID=UPI001EF533FC|nr:phosphate ABC transporter substrate-binding protein [Psychrobium sp. MM17-31]MCG7531015.1 phosphate ABC transporter substrate-binding protein [Psychrobium sp. MM17-31]